MRKILLPTDFSENSINAIDYAVALFSDVVCTFYILNVQKASSFISDDFRSMKPSTTIYQSLIENTKTSIKEIIAKVEETKNPKHEFKALVDYDNFIDAINQACKAKEIDLIIMGTKGATGAERVIFGSNTTRVIQRGISPVLAVPKGCEFKGLDRIVLPSNYLTRYREEEMLPLLQLAELFSSRIDVLHMVEEDQISAEQEKNKAFIDSCLKPVEHRFVDLKNGEIFKTIEKYIHDNGIDLLAMMSRKYSFIERLFKLHNAEKFAFELDVPMLMMENTGTIAIEQQ